MTLVTVWRRSSWGPGCRVTCRRVVQCRTCRPVGDVSCLPHSDWLFGSALGCWDPIRVGRRTPSLTIRSHFIRSPTCHMNRVVDRWGSEAPPWAGGTVRARGRGTNAHLPACSWAFHRLCTVHNVSQRPQSLLVNTNGGQEVGERRGVIF